MTLSLKLSGHGHFEDVLVTSLSPQVRGYFLNISVAASAQVKVNRAGNLTDSQGHICPQATVSHLGETSQVGFLRKVCGSGLHPDGLEQGWPPL